MSVDPVALRAVELLSRGHRLYGGPDPPTSPVTVPRPAPGNPVGGMSEMPKRRAAPLADALRHATATDTHLQALLGRACADRNLGKRATRTILDDARADPLPAADTPIGRREAVRRMAARLRAQHRRIRRSDRVARSLTHRLRRLRYPPGRRAARARAIPLAAVGYQQRFASGHVRRHIATALDRLGITDPVARGNWLRGYQTLIARESGGRPSVIAAQPAGAPGPTQADGHPLGYARGLTQTIPSTFAQYHQPGTAANIYDPVANICASMNYVMHRYGIAPDGANLIALVQQADAARPPAGY